MRPGGVYVDGRLAVRRRRADPVVDLNASRPLPGRTTGRTPPPPTPRRAPPACRWQTIRGGLRTFPGLAHRQELVATLDGVRFVNDCKATNADAAPRRWPATTRSTGSSAACRRPAGSTVWAVHFAHPARLPDRQAAEQFAARLEPMGCPIPVAAIWRPRLPGRDRGGAAEGCRRRRAAVARLRLLRPVPEFRSARRRLRGAGPRLASIGPLRRR